MQSYTRRRLLLATAAALTTTAGCSGGTDGTGGADGGAGSGRTATPTATPAESTATPTNTPTATEQPATETPTEQASVCASWEGETTRYDVSGTPFIFSYEYVETWNPGEITEYSQGHLHRFTSPPVGANDVTMTLRVNQTNNPLTAAERDDEIDYFLNFESEPRVIVDEITYDGESLRVLGLPDEDIALYEPGYTVFLPHGSGADRRYYPVGTTVFGSLQVDDADRETCIAALDDAQWAMLTSFEPNPDTTFDGA